MEKDFLSMNDLSKPELADILDLAARQKRGQVSDVLANKMVALYFEKPSLRTVCSFDVGAKELGAQTTFLNSQGSGKMGERERVKDLAKNLSGFYDAVVARVFSHKALEEFARESNIPVINALSDREHPCQILADLLTIREKIGKLDGIKLAYLGDGNNIAHSLALAAKIWGFDFALAGPRSHWLENPEFKQTEDLDEVLADADVVCTDTWTSMGDEAEAAERREIFAPYQLNSKRLAQAKPEAIVLHCQPAHLGEEITTEVFDGPQSAVRLEAANRLPVQKAVLMRLFENQAKRKKAQL